MKTFLKYAGVAVLAISLLGSCKKSFLELNSPTNVDPGVALATEADLLIALRGAYAGLRNVDLFGRSFPIWGDIMADNSYQHTLNTNRYTLYNNFTFNTTDANALGAWTAGYSAILRANRVIAAPLPASANVDQYKGEAYAIRALIYFNLVRYFARPYTDNPSGPGVPIVLTYDPELKPGRSTVQEVYAQINDDLNKAYTMMTRYVNSSQFSKYAAKGLQAKVYLTMNDMPNAKTAALDVINNGGFTAVTAANHAGYWAGSAVTTTKLETLFEVSSDAVANLAFDALSYIYSQAGNYGDLVVNDPLYALFETTDVRRALYPMATRGGASIPTVNKYPVISGDYSDTKVLRLSEMYLIAAEASYPAEETAARDYVNYVTSRRNATAIASTGVQLYEDIITERRKELAFEGDRYLDYMRLKRDIVRGTNYPAAARNIPYSNFRRVLPIPQTELDVNPTIRPQQNAGYN
ncbi:RagB/SusD family nutrient uptake outer membrane protein [Terrimonas sp. NA20]|uniref:RagB/SusD family nutrient uptake outer membrane protein n=1 Tax=Terrimonas ginsenosidimutans TaxID=2908004 RepID=A0ABS9KQ56_9BACT|nr:RagB/SusD family nutrient uptake outer membrane protein [Terrimonas ginsenosidimutans]MCG2614466.1 RagB/SusD family nutrient uptake outer membrane protein [Terrimonas ginsenosidimutans]